MKNKIEIFPINNEEDFDRAVLIAERYRPVNSFEEKIYMALLQLISFYDKANHALPNSSPSEVLSELMLANSLTQKDLARILETKQPNVSAILSKQRNISKKQAHILATYFHTDPSCFG
jgi:antitoxin component HigA of HigAB toxin-antitoxin module